MSFMNTFTSRGFYWLAAANVSGFGFTAAALMLKPDPDEIRDDTKRLVARAQAFSRATRLVSTVSTVAADYKVHEFRQYLFGNDEDKESQRLSESLRKAQDDQERAGLIVEKAQNESEKEKGIALANSARFRVLETAAQLEKLSTNSSRSKLHARNAERLLHLARTNGGVYIKVAQHCAQLGYLLPKEYISAFETCLDDAPRSKWSDVRAVIQEELGRIEDLFESFEQEPIASASLAQVHVAYIRLNDKSRQKVAVKVQHRGLRETSIGDIDACASAVKVVSYFFEDFKLAWLVDEISPHLPKELDFINEAKNCTRAAKDFSSTRFWRSRIVVPQVIENRTSERVLTMSFEEGVNATDKERMIAAGIDPTRAAALISQALNYAVFFTGHVQCDPHAANILVRPKKVHSIQKLFWSTPPQLVLLDHGLYRELSVDFRLQYARLWRALSLGDTALIAASARELGVGNLYPLFAAMLTRRPWDDLVANSLDTQPRSGDNALLRGYAQRYAKQITHVLDLVPRQMLLLLKMSDCLRNLESALGNSHYSHILTAHVCADALFAHDRNIVAYSRVKFRLYAFDVSVFFRRCWRRLSFSSDKADVHIETARKRPAIIPDHVSEWGTNKN